MPDELHVVSLVTLFDAVHTDGVAVCCVTGVTPMETGIGYETKGPRDLNTGHTALTTMIINSDNYL